MDKHAFLILAHDNPKTLSKLLSQIDNERNDIYLHLDIKSKIDSSLLKCVKANLVLIERTDVYWGEYSQTNATLRLLEAASKNNNYKYYHLLSGTTLLTKPLDEFYSFYDNTDLEYFHINRHTFKSIQKRCKYYYPFIKTKVFRKSKFVKGLSLIFGQIQAIIGINRLRKSPLNPIYNGMEWFSITDDYCRYILSKENLIYKTFHHTLAAEEVFVQTLAMHSDEFKNRVYGFNGKDDHIDASKTYQFWNSGKSTVIKTKEQLEIVQKDKRCFFARKFIDD